MSHDLDSAVLLIQKFQLFQEERAHTYKLFEEGHKIYLSSAPNYDFSKFRQLVNDVTQEFKRISQAMIAIEKQLRFGGHTELADIVSKLQDYEKIKLELSAKLQIIKKEAIDYPDEPHKQDEVVAIKQSLRDVIESVNDLLLELRHQIQEMGY